MPEICNINKDDTNIINNNTTQPNNVCEVKCDDYIDVTVSDGVEFN